MSIWHMKLPLSYKAKVKDKIEDRTIDFERILFMQTVAGLSLHQDIQKQVDEKFELNKSIYQDFLKEDYLETNSYFFSHPAENAFYMKKITAIFLATEEEKRGNYIVELIKSGFKKYYDIAIQEKEPFSIGKVLQAASNVAYSNTDGEQNTYIMMALFVRYQLEKYQVLHDSLLDTIFIPNLAANNNPIEKANEAQLFLDDLQQKEAFKSYEKAIGKKIPKRQTMDELIDQIEANSLKLIKSKGLRYQTNPDAIYTVGIYRHLKSHLALLFTYGIHDLFIWYNIVYTREDYLHFYGRFLIDISQERYTVDDFESAFAAHLIIFALTKNYRKLESLYLNELSHKNLAEIEKQKEELLEDKRQFESLKAEENRRNILISQENSALKNRIEILERELKKAQQSIEDDILLKQEVIALRDYVFNSEQTEETLNNEDETLESTIQELAKRELKMTIFGGHQRFVQRMKQSFPNIRTVSPDELHVDLSFVNNMDVILFDTSYNNHSNYFRMQDALTSDKPLLHFINREKSVELIASKILEKLQ